VASQINMFFVSRLTRALRYGHPLSISNRRASWSIVPILIAMAVGCSGGGSAIPAPTDSSMLRGIIRIYSTAARDLGRSPKNIDELKAVLAPVSKDPSEYLRSTRDGEEFAVVWGLNLATAPPDTVIAYERKGIDGKRMVVTVAGDLREVTPAEFAAIKFPKDYQPES
jgi:hypothetical protein